MEFADKRMKQTIKTVKMHLRSSSRASTSHTPKSDYEVIDCSPDTFSTQMKPNKKSQLRSSSRASSSHPSNGDYEVIDYSPDAVSPRHRQTAVVDIVEEPCLETIFYDHESPENSVIEIQNRIMLEKELQVRQLFVSQIDQLEKVQQQRTVQLDELQKEVETLGFRVDDVFKTLEHHANTDDAMKEFRNSLYILKQESSNLDAQFISERQHSHRAVREVVETFMDRITKEGSTTKKKISKELEGITLKNQTPVWFSNDENSPVASAGYFFVAVFKYVSIISFVGVFILSFII